MATKVSGKKATGTRKRKERKNIERGAVHIQSTFNNTLVTLTDMSGNALRATLFPGQVPAKWASEAQENLLPLLLRLLQRQLPRLLWSTV